ncbi:carboxypeptidase-like regulatory domain-containing protein [Algoriphagus sp.]|uniref:carboxypeptidase-like regulatory domain-containing protein n=1 Tax=Algoriphagus sp. TaxID=1872435 RepID=UPI00391D4674
MVRILISFVFFFFLVTFCYSQSTKTFFGKVVDLNSNEGLENVSVYIKDGNLGTFTNKNGNFVFSTELESGNLVFQLLGYKPFQISLDSNSYELLIKLHPDPFFLDEVVVKADSSLQIIKEAFSRLKENYPNKQFLLKGYYRESVLKDTSYVRYLDAAIGINDYSYRSDPLRRKVQVYNLRKSQNFVEEDLFTKLLSNLFGKENDFLFSLNFRDLLRRYHFEPSYFKGINKSILDFFDFKLDSIFNNGIDRIAKISFSAPTGMFSTNGFFLVNLSDFAVISIEMVRIPNDRFTADLFMKKALTNYSIVEYRKINDRYYLSRFYSQGTENLAAIDSDSKSGIQVLKMELWVNEIFDNKRFFDKVKNRNALAWETELKDLDIPYDPNFWKTFNFIPDSMEYNKMIRDLEKLKANE